jgi:DNA-binding transcriptional LysR family regulator
VKLLSRSKSGTSLNPPCHIVLSHAEKIFGEIEAMRRDLAPFVRNEQGLIRIYANYGAAIDFLPLEIAAFFKAHPHIRLSMEQHSSPEVVQGVASGKVDVGVSAFEGSYEGVQFTPYRKDHLVIVTPKDHPLAARKSVAFADCLSYEFVSLTEESAMQRFIFDKAEQIGKPITPKVQVNNQQILISLVQNGAGIAVVSRKAYKISRGKDLHVVDIEDAWAERNLRIAVAADEKKQSPMAVLFRQFLLDHS